MEYATFLFFVNIFYIWVLKLKDNMAKEEIKANDARLRTQVKEAWKDFKKRNPKVAKGLKHAADIASMGGISKLEIKKAKKAKK